MKFKPIISLLLVAAVSVGLGGCGTAKGTSAPASSAEKPSEETVDTSIAETKTESENAAENSEEKTETKPEESSNEESIGISEAEAETDSESATESSKEKNESKPDETSQNEQAHSEDDVILVQEARRNSSKYENKRITVKGKLAGSSNCDPGSNENGISTLSVQDIEESHLFIWCYFDTDITQDPNISRVISRYSSDEEKTWGYPAEGKDVIVVLSGQCIINGPGSRPMILSDCELVSIETN